MDAGLVTSQPHPQAGRAHVLAPPYPPDGARLPVRFAPPQLGTDTERVLGSLLGLTPEDISELRSKGVV